MDRNKRNNILKMTILFIFYIPLFYNHTENKTCEIYKM